MRHSSGTRWRGRLSVSRQQRTPHGPTWLLPAGAAASAAVAAGHNVLVAAHTSAGKTVVAEYAFAMGMR